MHASLAESVGPLGAELLLVDATTVDATFDGLLQVGAKVGAADAMQQQVDDARTQLAALALPQPVDTLALFGSSARWLVVTPQGWLGDLLGQLGFRPVAGGAGGAQRIPGYAEVSDEQIAATRPALVLVVGHGDPRAIRAQLGDKIAPSGAWSGVAQSAVRGVHVLDPSRFTVNPGLALPDAARELIALSNGGASAPTPPVGAAR
jgi:ABC-type Fe3+-hydroxamate transport system substrate-binding protein